MDDSLPQPPLITSFVIRFIHSDEAQATPTPQPDQENERVMFRGTIRHVQTNQELAFTAWQEAFAFIQRFVAIPPEKQEK